MTPELPPGASRCKYVDICGLPGDFPGGNENFCMLHLPDPARKNHQVFERLLRDHTDSGRCDFRYFYWPQTLRPNFTGRQFVDVVDFRGAAFSGTMLLDGSRFEKGLLLGGSQFANVSLRKATLRGPLKIDAAVNNTVDLAEAVFEAPVTIQVDSAFHLRARLAQFRQGASIQATHLLSLHLDKAEFPGGFILRGQCDDDRNFRETQFQGVIDWRACEFIGPLLLSVARFDERTTLILSHALVRGDVILVGRDAVPGEIHLTNTRIQGTLRIEAELGAHRPRIVAQTQPLRFQEEIRLTNVNLSQCLVIGNVIRQMILSNVEWHRRRWRYVLYDEVIYHEGNDIPVRNIREAYQILKQDYQSKGDHVRAGDFHYGEMEMKRREYGWPKRVLCPEFVYWALSGYGTGYLRAFFMLIALVVGFAGFYWWIVPTSFSQPPPVPDDLPERLARLPEFLKALYFSVQVTTLQRPPTPEGFSTHAQWIQLAQSILGPVQIALFALALRMRLKR